MDLTDLTMFVQRWSRASISIARWAWRASVCIAFVVLGTMLAQSVANKAMRASFDHLLGHTWSTLLISLSSSTLQIVVFSVAVPVFSFVGFLIYNSLQVKRTGDSVIAIVTKTIVPTMISVAVTSTAWIILFACFLVRTAYKDHISLLEDNRELNAKVRTMLQEKGDEQHRMDALANEVAALRNGSPPESSSSLRRRTITLADELYAFIVDRDAHHPPVAYPPDPKDSPPDEELKKKIKTYADYQQQTQNAYMTKYRERMVGIVQEYKAKGIATGWLENMGSAATPKFRLPWIGMGGNVPR